jgi:hypothetical protein
MKSPPKPTKQIVAFKVEPELGAMLDAMPNKSEFIRAAVQARLANACPLCRGTGVAPYHAVGDDLTRLVQQHPLVICAGCGSREPRPCHAPGHCDPAHCDDDRRRALFERFGTYYCAGCFASVAVCRICGRPMEKGKSGRSRPTCASCSAA